MKTGWKRALLLGFSALIGISNLEPTSAGSYFYYNDRGSLIGNEQKTNYGEIITTDAVKKNDGLLTKLMQVLKLDITNKYNGPQKAFYYIRSVLNYALGFVSFIAFLLLLYGFYMMLIGDGEKGREKVKSTLKGIAIAIIAMSLSWLIVSALFRIYQNPAQKDTPTSQSIQQRP